MRRKLNMQVFVGVTQSGKHNTQVIIGTQVRQVGDEIESQLESK